MVVAEGVGDGVEVAEGEQMRGAGLALLALLHIQVSAFLAAPFLPGQGHWQTQQASCTQEADLQEVNKMGGAVGDQVEVLSQLVKVHEGGRIHLKYEERVYQVLSKEGRQLQLLGVRSEVDGKGLKMETARPRKHGEEGAEDTAEDSRELETPTFAHSSPVPFPSHVLGHAPLGPSARSLVALFQSAPIFS